MITLKSNIIRYDTQGSGNYGASRGSRTHNGVDLLCVPECEVYADTDLEFIRIARPYPGMNGGLWEDMNGNQVKIFYMNPIRSQKTFKRGDVIGYCQNVAKHYKNNRMMPHIHIEIYENKQRINPEQRITIS